MLALLFAVEAHRFLLYPRHFLWISDNRSLKYIASMSPPKGITQRWLTLLANFNFDVEHRSNNKMNHVDFLSRDGAARAQTNTMMDNDNEAEFRVNSIVLRYGAIEDINWKKEQDEDPTIRLVRTWVINKQLPRKDLLKRYSIDTQRYAKIFDKLRLDEGTGILLNKKYNNEHLEIDDYRICLPKSKENAILGHYHSNAAAGHYGIIATIKRILQKYWVPRPTIMVTKFIATCLQCQRKMQSPLSTLKTHRKVM